MEQASRDLKLIDERERREKAEARLDAGAAELERQKWVIVGVALGVFAIGVLAGGITGALAF